MAVWVMARDAREIADALHGNRTARPRQFSGCNYEGRQRLHFQPEGWSTRRAHLMAATGAPWVDVHAHPGRCFLAGLDAGDPLAGLMGGQDVAATLSAAREAGLAAVTLSTVVDLRVLAPDPVKGLRASRAFAPGEAYADHRRQLARIGEVLAWLGAPVALTAEDIEGAWASGQTAVLVGCEGGDFLEGRLEALEEARALGASPLTLGALPGH